MGLIIEIVLRIFVSVINQFTKKDLNEFIDQFPKDVGEKIGQAVKGNLTPISDWLSKSTANIKLFVSALSKNKVKHELYAPDEGLLNIEELIKAVLESIKLIKKPILLKEFFGNVNYYSLWQVNGYTNNAYSASSYEIKLNDHFTISLIEADKIRYNRLMNIISNSRPISKKTRNKSLKIKTIRIDEATTFPKNLFTKLINYNKNIPLNFSIESYLNLLADIEYNIENSSKSKTFWSEFKSYINL